MGMIYGGIELGGRLEILHAVMEGLQQIWGSLTGSNRLCLLQKNLDVSKGEQQLAAGHGRTQMQIFQ
jgi:hypothetical protein